jgi:hypothetical protein
MLQSRKMLFLFICSLGLILHGSSNQTLNSSKQLTPSYQIINNPNNPDTYQLIIQLTNNGSDLTNGWQLQFNFSTPDQQITRIHSGIAQTTSNLVTIINLPQHIRTNGGFTRTIRITVRKNAQTIPGILGMKVTTPIESTTRSKLNFNAL